MGAAMYNAIQWKRSSCDMCSILTSNCGVYEIRQNYDCGYDLYKRGGFIGCGYIEALQKQCKEYAEWDKKHN